MLRRCKNCSVPKPSSWVPLDKNEFLSRTKRSTENLNQDKRNSNDDQNQNLISNIEPCKQIDFEKKQNYAEVKLKSDENIVVKKHKLHSNDEISVLSFEEKIKLLEKNFHPREFIPQSKEDKELVHSTLNPSQQPIKATKKIENIDIKRPNDSIKKENKVPKTIRNMYKNDEKKVRFEKNINDFDKKYIEEFENKLKFFEDKNSPALISTRSLESFEPKPIFADTYQIVRNIKNKEFPIYGSNKSLDHSHFNIDNLNDIPKILGSISETNIRSSKTDIFQSSEYIDKTYLKIIPRENRNDKENSEGITVPKVKPRKNWSNNKTQVISKYFLFVKSNLDKRILKNKF